MKPILNAFSPIYNGLRLSQDIGKKKILNRLQIHFTQVAKRNLGCDVKERSAHSASDDDGRLYVSTSAKGITEEIEIPVPWGIVAAKVYGDSNGPPVLCIHGWLDNCNSFDTLIPLLPKDKFYVFIDLPGHGKSSGISVGSFYTFVDNISLVERIRRHFSWPCVSFLSHSLGANISGVYSGTFPEKVDKLIFLDVLGFHTIRAGTEVETLRSSIESYASYEAKTDRVPQTYSYDAAKQRLLKANESLTSTSADILLERGTQKLSNGSYKFIRDLRHTYRKPTGIYGHGAIPFLAKTQAETIHILAEDGMVKKAMRKKKYEGAIDNFFSTCFQNCEHYERVFVPGKHHVHLCNPTHVIDHVTALLNRPMRAGLLKSSGTDIS